MTYEEKILTYLDGSFSDDESAELLHQLSVSPEKRVVLEQHLQLRSLTAQAQQRETVPPLVEEQLGMRLPIIAQYNREIAAGIGFVSQLGRESLFVRGLAAVRNIVATRPARIAGGIAALLVIGTLFFANTTTDEPLLTSETKVIPIGSPSSVLPSTSSELAKTASSQARNAVVLNAERSSVSDPVIANKNLSSAPAKGYSSKENYNINTNSSAISIKEEEAVITTKENAFNNSSANTSSADVSSFVISPVSDMRGASRSEIITNNIGEPMRAVPFGIRSRERSNLPLLLRLDGSFGSSFIRVKQSDAGTTTRFEATPTFGVDLIVSPYISFGAEFGSAGVSHILPHQVLDNSGGIVRVVTGNTIEASNEYYLRGAVRFVPNPYDMFRLEASVGGGISLEGTNSPLVTASLMGNYSLTEMLGLSAGFVFSGAFTKTNNELQRISADQAPEGEPIGYVQENTGASSLFVPSVTFRIGFRIKPW